jgi:hypothetical protein
VDGLKQLLKEPMPENELYWEAQRKDQPGMGEELSAQGWMKNVLRLPFFFVKQAGVALIEKVEARDLEIGKSS